MIMTTLKWFLWWRITYELDVYVEKNIPIDGLAQ